MSLSGKSLREQKPQISLVLDFLDPDTPFIGTVIKASPRKMSVEFKDDDYFLIPDDHINEKISFTSRDFTVLFKGKLEKKSPSYIEINILAMDDAERISYNNFLLNRLDKQYELSRKVEELALEEIQQLNKELSLALKVEEAALTETQRMNEELLVAQRELLQSRNLLQAIFDSITEGIYLIDKRYKLLAYNKKQRERSQYRPSDDPGLKCYQILYRNDTPCVNCPAALTFHSGKPEKRSWHIPSRDKVAMLEYSSFPVHDDRGDVVQAVQYVQDITERKEIEEHLFQTEKMASLGTMTAGIAHELKNPLSSISMTIQLLKRKHDFDEAVLKKLDKVETQVNKAGKIVADVKRFSRKEKLMFSKVDLVSHLGKLIKELEELGTFKSVELVTDFMYSASVNIEPDQFDQVLINLFKNAIDALELQEAPRIRVITEKSENNSVRVIIEDNGSGMSDSQIQKIFDPFFTTKPPGKGTGLGLAISYKIIERHRGTIKVQSQLHRGSRFIITLPVIESYNG